MLQRAIIFDGRTASFGGGLLASAALTASLAASADFKPYVGPDKTGEIAPRSTLSAPLLPRMEERPDEAPAKVASNDAARAEVGPATPRKQTVARLSFASRPLVLGDAVRIDLPPVQPLAPPVEPQRVARTETAPAPSIVVTAPRTVAAAPPSDAYVDQIGRVAESTVHIAQLSQPVGRGGAQLAERTAAMQVLPALNLTDGERSKYLALAPEQLTLRIGESAAGRVAVAMGDGSAMSVQLGGLLDALSDRLAPADFERLRSSSAADSFVTLDQLRAAGIALRYDAVYDELRLAG